MNQTVQVQGVQPNELCDRDEVATAVVAIETENGARFVFCRHHFNEIPGPVIQRFRSINDSEAVAP